jgi:SAM-dependent methyltransferase
MTTIEPTTAVTDPKPAVALHDAAAALANGADRDDGVSRAGYSVSTGRQAKAAKILAVVAAARGPLTPELRILDIGTGSGGIAAAIDTQASVFATDAIDQRTERGKYSFVVADERLPFAAGTFDVVISNHVIEHVADPDCHLAEIRRVMKPSAVCYLATPNRWWPLEVHSRLALVHWLPPPVFNRLAMRWGCLREPVTLQSLNALRHRSRGLLIVEPWHDRLVLDPRQYGLDLPAWARAVVKAVPPPLIRWSRTLHPTLIAILRPWSR